MQLVSTEACVIAFIKANTIYKLSLHIYKPRIDPTQGTEQPQTTSHTPKRKARYSDVTFEKNQLTEQSRSWVFCLDVSITPFLPIQIECNFTIYRNDKFSMEYLRQGIRSHSHSVESGPLQL